MISISMNAVPFRINMRKINLIKLRVPGNIPGKLTIGQVRLWCMTHGARYGWTLKRKNNSNT